MHRSLHEFFVEEEGQAITEYILLLALAIAVMTSMRAGVKQFTGKIWALLAKRIAAPCAECSAEDDFTL